MKRGVIFYNWGTSGIPRLLVALSSFRKHNPVCPVTLMVPPDDPTLPRYRRDVKDLDVGVQDLMVPLEYRGELQKVTAKVWAFERSPYESTVVYENDMLFQAPIGDIFALGEPLGFGITLYHGRIECTRGNRNLARVWPDFPRRDLLLKEDSGVHNHGVVYGQRGNIMLHMWREHMELWKKWTVAEEIICNLLASATNQEPHTWGRLPERFNTCVRFASQKDVDEAAALHYLGGRHIGGSRRNDSALRWRQAYEEFRATKPWCLDELVGWDQALA